MQEGICGFHVKRAMVCMYKLISGCRHLLDFLESCHDLIYLGRLYLLAPDLTTHASCWIFGLKMEPPEHHCPCRRIVVGAVPTPHLVALATFFKK